MWLCSEDRLGRVGALKWSSVATAVSLLVMAASHSVTALFVPVSLVTLFFMGECWRLGRSEVSEELESPRAVFFFRLSCILKQHAMDEVSCHPHKRNFQLRVVCRALGLFKSVTSARTMPTV